MVVVILPIVSSMALKALSAVLPCSIINIGLSLYFGTIE